MAGSSTHSSKLCHWSSRELMGLISKNKRGDIHRSVVEVMACPALRETTTFICCSGSHLRSNQVSFCVCLVCKSSFHSTTHSCKCRLGVFFLYNKTWLGRIWLHMTVPMVKVHGCLWSQNWCDDVWWVNWILAGRYVFFPYMHIMVSIHCN
jgi:hypothetical protein